jgi:hypothetical protein
MYVSLLTRVKDEPGEGFFTDGSFVLVEGEYTEEGTLEIIAIGQPPCEPRETARSIYGHIDFLGKGATSLLEDVSRSLSHHQIPRLTGTVETICNSNTARTYGHAFLLFLGRLA